MVRPERNSLRNWLRTRPPQITILLSSAAYEALSRVANLHTAVSVALRRFDNRHVQLYWYAL